MARVFVSYSRVDRTFADQLTQHLRRVYGYQNIWLDEVLHGGQLWWEEILHQIAECDIFIYLLTRDSLESPYCRAEYEEALRLQKLILPVVIRARTVAPQDMLRYQFVDMSAGLTVDSMTDLQAAITQLSAQIPPSPLPPRAPTPTNVPPMTGAIAIGGPSASERARQRARLIGGLAIVALLVVGALLLLPALNGGGSAVETPTGTATERATDIAAMSTEIEPTLTLAAQSSATPDSAATTQASTDTTVTAQVRDDAATATESAESTATAQTLDTQTTATAESARDATATAQARDADASATGAVNATATAHTLDMDATATAQSASEATATRQALDQQAIMTQAAAVTITAQAQAEAATATTQALDRQATADAVATRDADSTRQASNAQATAAVQTAQASATQAAFAAESTAQALDNATATGQALTDQAEATQTARDAAATQAAQGTATAQVIIDQTAAVRAQNVLATSQALSAALAATPTPTPTPTLMPTATEIGGFDPACAVTLEADGAEPRGYALPSHASFSIALPAGTSGALIARLSDRALRGWRRVRLTGLLGTPLVWVDETVSLSAAGRCDLAQTSIEFVFIERFLALLTPPAVPLTYYSDTFGSLTSDWVFTVDGASTPLQVIGADTEGRGLQLAAADEPGLLAHEGSAPMGDLLAAFNFRQRSLSADGYVGVRIGVPGDESTAYEIRLTAPCVIEVWREDAGGSSRLRSTRPLTSCANGGNTDKLLEISYVGERLQVGVNGEPSVLTMPLERLAERGDVRVVIYQTELALDYIVVAGT